MKFETKHINFEREKLSELAQQRGQILRVEKKLGKFELLKGHFASPTIFGV